MLELRYYVTEDGRSPFSDWFSDLDAPVRARIATSIMRLGQGNLSNVKSLGDGVLEYRIEFGPGYRLYFGRDGAVVVILLTGGTKKRQPRDIERAKRFWTAYKQRKRGTR